MAEIITFFADFENTLYFILGASFLLASWRFYRAWQELRSSMFGLEQINAQRRLNNAAIGMFLLVLMGFMVFSLVTFVQPALGLPGTTVAQETLPAEVLSGEGLQDTPEVTASTPSGPATATPEPAIEINQQACHSDPEDAEKINILSPRWNQQVSGLVDVDGIVDVLDFSFWNIALAQADSNKWQDVAVSTTMMKEEDTLVTFDSSTFSPGNYVLQLLVAKHDGSFYEPCRIPISIAPSN